MLSIWTLAQNADSTRSSVIVLSNEEGHTLSSINFKSNMNENSSNLFEDCIGYGVGLAIQLDFNGLLFADLTKLLISGKRPKYNQ